MMDGGVTAMGKEMGGDDDDGAGGIVALLLNAEGDVFIWRQFDCGCFGDWGDGGVIWLSTTASFCEEEEDE